MLKKNLPRLAITVAVLCCFAAGGWYWGQYARHRPHFPHSKIEITRSDGKKFTYDVEVARDLAEQEYGLMYIRSMADDAGMIFPYDPPREVAFWMKNTYIPLDMIFVGKDHRIGHIATNARPLDVMPITSEVSVTSVIELNAGQVDQKGFSVGDTVFYAGLNQ